MKLILRQKLWLTFVILVNLGLWIVPSNVVEQIARDRHVMLGRYSRTHFIWIVGVFVLSAVSLYIDSAVGAAYKRRWFQVIAIVLCLIPGLAVIDFLMRGRQRVYYVKDTLAYHRIPNDLIRDRFEDRPIAARTFPQAPQGYPAIEGSLRTDAQGFRNASVPAQADVVALGDSFTEGSGVSDEHPWPVRLAERTGLSVHNLGMSGYDPLNYLESLKQYGLALKPKLVLCMIYEGNDFRSAKNDTERAKPGFMERLHNYSNQSPLLGAVDGWLIATFGPMRSQASLKNAEPIDWLPLRLPPGPQAKPYAFAPKQLADLYRPAQDFAANRKWMNTQRILGELNAACQAADTRLVILYAPTKAHVTLPLAVVGPQSQGQAGLSAEKVRAFLALDEDEENLPDAEQLLADLLSHAGGRESVVAQWCAQSRVPFLSATKPLAEACMSGRQVYFTYDQHWTPEGHEVVAQAAAEFLSGHNLLALAPPQDPTAVPPESAPAILVSKSKP